eukprot:COSAG01_NODE_30797_length_609_cov_1.256863_1_plen_82_part_01
MYALEPVWLCVVTSRMSPKFGGGVCRYTVYYKTCFYVLTALPFGALIYLGTAPCDAFSEPGDHNETETPLPDTSVPLLLYVV